MFTQGIHNNAPFSFGVCPFSLSAWVTSHQSTRRYQVCFPPIFPFDPWTLPQRDAVTQQSPHPTTPLICTCTLTALMPTHLCCLSTVKLISSLSPVEKSPQTSGTPSAQQRPSRAESRPSWSTTENQPGVTDLKKIKYLGGLAEARGKQRLMFQVDNGGTVKVERVFFRLL